MKLNIGCGPNKIEGYINIDSEECVHPDLIHDITEGPLPYEDGSVDEITFFHCIEHVSKVAHEIILMDFRRVLKDGGRIYISYPNFRKCAQNWLVNKDGNRAFWEKTIYGRQIHKGDYHVAAITPDYMAELLLHCGFDSILSIDEENDDYNTITTAKKILNAPISYEEVVKQQVLTTQVEVIQ